MSDPYLAPELLDHIIDLLHDARHALGNCSLVSKSWIPRARKHLFADIRFDTTEKLQLWTKVFTNPSTSPAHYAKTLSIDCPHLVTAVDAEEGGWIRAFSQIEQLEVGRNAVPRNTPVIPLLPFHGLSPVVKTLRIDFTLLSSSKVFDLIFSFPLLEDLTAVTYNTRLADNGNGPDDPSTTAQPSSSPTFTGSLTLRRGGMERLVNRLLSLPGGIHFRKLDLTWFREEDSLLAAALVDRCSHTLESLDVSCEEVPGTSIRYPYPPSATYFRFQSG